MPSLTKPDYLASTLEPTFNTYITRITGNPGDYVPNLTNKTWGTNLLRHGYSIRQPWNADQSILFLENCSPAVFVDGKTYEVLFEYPSTKSYLYEQRRWHNSNPEIMICNYKSDQVPGMMKIVAWNVISDTETILFDSTSYENATIGGHGNLSQDSKWIVVKATRKLDSKIVVFAVDLENATKSVDIDITSLSCGAWNISPLANYIVIEGSFATTDNYKIYNRTTGALLQEWNETGVPSHADFTVYDGVEYIVGGERSGDISGHWVVKRQLNNGAITLLFNSWATHSSTQNINRPGWVFCSTYDYTTSYLTRCETYAVKLDGTRVERICHNRASNPGNYYFEAQSVPSRDGLRVLFASDWETGVYPVQAYIADFKHKLVNKVGHWDLDENTGSTVNDSSYYGLDGTITGAAWVSGKVGKALDFDGVDDYVAIPDADRILDVDNFTISSWVYYPATAQSHNEFIYASKGIYIYRNQGDNLKVVFQYPYTALSIQSVPTEEWFDLAVTYDGQDINVFINGVLEGTKAASGMSFKDHGGTVYLGAESTSAGFFNGKIDDLKIFNYAMDELEIGKIGHWKIDENTSSTINDYSCYDLDGSITGAAWMDDQVGALDFDGIDDYVAIPDANRILDVDTFTISLWAYYPATAQSHNEFIYASKGIYIYRNQGNNLKAVFQYPYKEVSIQSIPTEEWFHIAATYDGQDINVFINGVLEGTKAASGMSLKDHGGTVYLGAESTFAGFLKGGVDDVQVFNYALSTSKIGQLCNQ